MIPNPSVMVGGIYLFLYLMVRVTIICEPLIEKDVLDKENQQREVEV